MDIFLGEIGTPNKRSESKREKRPRRGNQNTEKRSMDKIARFLGGVGYKPRKRKRPKNPGNWGQKSVGDEDWVAKVTKEN